MDFDFDALLNTIFPTDQEIPHIPIEKIPEIPLYMDQVTSLMDELLSSTRRYDTDKLLTKTMINNYAKNKLLPAPDKKKYNRQHMLLLAVIYYFKGFLSLQDIQSLLKPLNENFFGNDKDPGLDTVYQTIFAQGVPDMKELHDQVAGYIEAANRAFPDTDDSEEQDFLRFFSLITYLSMDVYLKKHMIERLIDERTHKSPKE